MKREPTQREFLKDVSTHDMIVVLEGKEHRHLVFRRKDFSFNQRFEVITFPGTLVYTGDMGTFVFSRTSDMFTFFRGKDNGALKINPYYWSEKLQAGSGCGRPIAQEYDGDYFKKNVLDSLKSYGLKGKSKQQVIEELSWIDFDQPESVVMKELYDFDCKFDHEVPEEHNKSFGFDAPYEIPSKVWTYHFIWCCYAIVWAIRVYDKAKLKAAQKGKPNAANDQQQAQS